MKNIKIDFVDFWPQLDKKNNYFFNILSTKYNVIIDEIKPDVIFFSVFGENHLNYVCKKIFFTGENVIPNLNSCDLAFSFDFLKHKKHFRLPLYSIYKEYFDARKIVTNKDKDYKKIWEKKKKFCCMVVSNPNAKERISFFKKLSNYLPVDSGGSVLNNVGGRVADKLEFINNYKFVISFENEISEGYTTEKILEPIIKDCIPIYWGNKLIHKDFNSERFLNYHKFNTEEDLIKKILELNSNPELAIDMISKPILSNDRVSFEKEKEQVLERILFTLNNTKKPIAKTLPGIIYKYKKKYSNKRLFKYTKYNFLNLLKIK